MISKQSLIIQSLSLHIQPSQAIKQNIWAYCILKSSSNSYCTSCKQIISKQYVNILSPDTPFTVDITQSHFLFKLQIWDYDQCQKISQTHIFNSDLPKNKNQIQHITTDGCQRSVHINFQYQRIIKNRDSSVQKSQLNNIVNQRSQSKLKIISKNNSMNKFQNDRIYNPDYGCSIFGRVNIPLRKQSNYGFRLRL